MRAIGLFLLSLCVASNAWAQAAPAATPPAKFNAQGKIQIGYDKRADYPLIKLPSKSAAAPTAANAPTSTAQNLDGSIFDPRNQAANGANSTFQPVNAAAAAAQVRSTQPQPVPTPSAPAAVAVAAPAAKPALSGDSALFRPSTLPAPTTNAAPANNTNSSSNSNNNNNNSSGNGSTVNGYAVVGGKLTKL